MALTAYGFSPEQSRGGGDVALRVALAVVLIGAAVAVAAYSINRSEFPLVRALQMLTAIVAIMTVVFAYVYLLTSTNDPSAFSEPLDHTDALYFTLTTSTTVGFGDIHPTSDPARVVVMVQMAMNVIIIGIVTRVLFGTARKRAEAS